MNKTNRYTKRSGYTKSLNDDRGDAFWQVERGSRYSQSNRKWRAKMKVKLRRKERRKNKNFEL